MGRGSGVGPGLPGSATTNCDWLGMPLVKTVPSAYPIGKPLELLVIRVKEVSDHPVIASTGRKSVCSLARTSRCNYVLPCQARGWCFSFPSPDHTPLRCSRRHHCYLSPRHQHLAIGQQRCRVLVAVRCPDCRSPFNLDQSLTDSKSRGVGDKTKSSYTKSVCCSHGPLGRLSGF